MRDEAQKLLHSNGEIAWQGRQFGYTAFMAPKEGSVYSGRWDSISQKPEGVVIEIASKKRFQDEEPLIYVIASGGIYWIRSSFLKEAESR